MSESENKEPIPSPYPIARDDMMAPEKPFDYNQHQDETTIKAMEQIYKTLGENASLLVFPHTADTAMITENVSAMSIKLLNVLIDNKVPVKDLSKISENIEQMIFMIFTEISKQRNGFQNEFLARALGTRDPGNNDYSETYATIGDIFLALKQLRDKQGDPNGEHYWKISKKPEPGADTEPAV